MTCNYCNSEDFKYLTSSTNSTYTYCRDYLKIEVKKDYNTIGLIINNINVFEMDFKYEFSKKDIYYIENVIFELVQDFYDFDLSKVDIIVCE